MNFHPEQPKLANQENDIFSAFKRDSNTGIKQGMSPKEIAEVTSNHLINVIKEQFEAAKRQFNAGG